jgi:site-specific recombinase XerD
MVLEEIQNKSYYDLLTSFLEDLENRNYGKESLQNYRRTLCKIDSFMIEQGDGFYTPTVGSSYYNYYVEAHDIKESRKKSLATAIQRLNDYYSGTAYRPQHARELKPIPDGFRQQVELFLSCCLNDGNKDNTINTKHRFLADFLVDCSSLGCNDIKSLSPAVVCKACIMIENKDSWAVIRNFLCFLTKMGTTETDLSTFIPHYKRKTSIPVVYTEEEIYRFEESIDRSSDIGKRDYAMLMLATRLGIRSGDIAKMTLGDLDFKNDELRFKQQKGGEIQRLPMLPEVKTALEDYITHARPSIDIETVFLRHNAPYQGITTSALRFSVTKYFEMAGVDISARKHGPHAFRSSLASSMVNGNVPYEAVRKVLGHSDPDAIKHYARLDIAKLRECAIEVPQPAGTFKMFLDGGALND